MGLFQHRPEEPTDWTGLPSEPVRHLPGEVLDASTALSLDQPWFAGSGDATSISVDIAASLPGTAPASLTEATPDTD